MTTDIFDGSVYICASHQKPAGILLDFQIHKMCVGYTSKINILPEEPFTDSSSGCFCDIKHHHM